ncbi:MAG: hypothetical protein ACR2LE_08775 [Nocardioidaceae bacterium]
MFDLVNVHTPLAVALLALALILLVGGIFVAVRVMGHRDGEPESPGQTRRPPDNHL